MILPWIAAVAALAAAIAAWMQGRRNRRRLEQLTQMYWELKYQHSELRSELQKRTGQTPPAARPPEPAAPIAGFVPLRSLKN
jgi:predicted NodU family carbamoyl transferase